MVPIVYEYRFLWAGPSQSKVQGCHNEHTHETSNSKISLLKFKDQTHITVLHVEKVPVTGKTC